MSDNAVINMLTEAESLLTKKGWTQQTFARDEFGVPTYTYAESACSFCLRGALLVAAKMYSVNTRYDVEHRLHQALAKVLSGADFAAYIEGRVDVVSYNDAPGRTREDVLNLVDIAKRMENGE